MTKRFLWNNLTIVGGILKKTQRWIHLTDYKKRMVRCECNVNRYFDKAENYPASCEYFINIYIWFTRKQGCIHVLNKMKLIEILVRRNVWTILFCISDIIKMMLTLQMVWYLRNWHSGLLYYGHLGINTKIHRFFFYNAEILILV